MLACDTRFEDNNLVWRMRSRKVIVRGLQPHVVSTPEMSTQLRLVRQAMLEQIRLTLVYPSSSVEELAFVLRICSSTLQAALSTEAPEVCLRLVCTKCSSQLCFRPHYRRASGDSVVLATRRRVSDQELHCQSCVSMQPGRTLLMP
jgi:predicted metal-binding protein